MHHLLKHLQHCLIQQIDYQGINRLYSNGFFPLRVLLLLVLTAFIVARLFGLYFIIFLYRVISLLLLSSKRLIIPKNKQICLLNFKKD